LAERGSSSHQRPQRQARCAGKAGREKKNAVAISRTNKKKRRRRKDHTGRAKNRKRGGGERMGRTARDLGRRNGERKKQTCDLFPHGKNGPWACGGEWFLKVRGRGTGLKATAANRDPQEWDTGVA